MIFIKQTIHLKLFKTRKITLKKNSRLKIITLKNIQNLEYLIKKNHSNLKTSSS